MRRLLLSALAATISALAAASEPTPVLNLHNKAMDFVTFWDAAKDKPRAEQLAQFNASVAQDFPAFYSIERFDGEVTQAHQDERIGKSIDEFPSLREGYIKKAQQFETELPKYIATFKAEFPDYVPTYEIYVLHSLGEMDGGTRTINGKNYLVFGIDGMVKYHGMGRESAFFHHELFHTYHASMAACDDDTVWSALWREGLATYVSKVMDPDATEVETLLDIPNHMAEQTQAVLPAALDQLEKVLDHSDHATYAGLFNFRADGSGLPPRRGYYLGYLVAQEAAKTHDIHELAKLECGSVKKLVFATVNELRAKVQQPVSH
jgi:hypothetical protein